MKVWARHSLLGVVMVRLLRLHAGRRAEADAAGADDGADPAEIRPFPQRPDGARGKAGELHPEVLSQEELRSRAPRRSTLASEAKTRQKTRGSPTITRPQVFFAEVGGPDREARAYAREFPSGVVCVATVAFYGQDPPDVRVRHEVAKTFDEARQEGTEWCQQQFAEGPKKPPSSPQSLVAKGEGKVTPSLSSDLLSVLTELQEQGERKSPLYAAVHPRYRLLS